MKYRNLKIKLFVKFCEGLSRTNLKQKLLIKIPIFNWYVKLAKI